MFRSCREVIRVSDNKKKHSGHLKTYKCEFCSQGWQSETEVYYHKKVHFKQLRNEKRWAPFCWTCIKQYKTSEQLIKHYKLCHLFSTINARRVERQIFVCNDCSSLFFNKKMLVIHMNRSHKKSVAKQRFECPKCTKKVKIEYVWGHFLFHDMVGLRTCPICFIKFSNWKDLQNHMISHPKDLHCYICGINFDKHSLYVNHLEKHIIQSDTPYNRYEEESPLINKYFIPYKTNSKTMLYLKLQPYQGLRIQEEISICILCREICTTYKERKEHILQHYQNKQEEQPAPQYACCCGEIFLHRILLRQHLSRNKTNGDELHAEVGPAYIEHFLSGLDENASIEVV